MRKPLVVACVAAATLAAGGVTATAMAQPSPGAPEVPDVPTYGVPQLPDGDFEDPSPRASGQGGWNGVSMAAPAGQSTAPSASPSASVTPGDSKPRNSEPRDGEPRDGESRDGEPRDGGSQDGETGDRGRGRGDDRERPAPEGARPAADPFAAARVAVTAGSISASPDAPVQQQVLALVNRNREKAGCGALTPDRRLIEAANAHAADMARRGYFAHESPRGDRAGSRVAGTGYKWKRYGENIARGQDTPHEVVTDWMNSPEHRENILDCRLDQMGVGLAIAGDDTPYWVQDLATPR